MKAKILKYRNLSQTQVSSQQCAEQLWSDANPNILNGSLSFSGKLFPTFVLQYRYIDNV